ncbi:L,D-transpeptidase family protein [Rhizobiaceae bacterium]|nr:L,D-transpeptidase family protein [Rhizobiaceae bacterium]
MTNDLSRRNFLAKALAVGAAGGGMAATPAFSQTAIDRILNSNGRDAWDAQFATNGVVKQSVASNTPIFAPQTASFIERAQQDYRGIVAAGGWARVPDQEKLQLGVSSPSVSALRRRLIVSGDLPAGAGTGEQFDSYVDAAVKRFQTRHGLPGDGVVGRYSFAALNVSAPVRLGQLETNLVRLRSMSGYLGDRYVMVNIPAAEIEAVTAGSVDQRHTAIVGRITRQTPILNSKIYELNLNPYWTAPKSIIRKDIIPLMQKDPNYLKDNQILIFDGNGNEVPPQTINWNTDEAVKYRFRQEPGRNNAMSSVKINFPNPHAVYMHDTPQQGLFNKLMRFDSSGCVRVKNVRDLLVWLAKDTPAGDRRQIESVIASGDRTDLKLAAPVPVYFTYITAWSTDNGVVQFRDDIYKRDGVDELAFKT